MDQPITHPSATLPPNQALLAALDWWHAAGVDLGYDEKPIDWFNEAEEKAAQRGAKRAGQSGAGQTGTGPSGSPAASRAAPEPAFPASAYPNQNPQNPATGPLPSPAQAPAAMGGPPEQWPQDLPAFQTWWTAEPSLDGGHVTARVAPIGAACPRLMVLVPQPEEVDAQTGQLLSDAQGRLLRAMLAAMGIAPEQAYLAAALPRAMPAPDWAGLEQAGLGRILCHHIALVQPERLLVLGHGILPLLGHRPSQFPALLPFVNHVSSGQTDIFQVPVLAGMEPALLLDRPKAKAGLWQQWLRWPAMGEDAQERPFG